MDYREFKGKKQRSFFGYFVVGLVGAVVGAFLVLVFAPASIFSTSTTQTPQKQPVKVEETKVNITTDVSSAASKVSPSVVSVVTTKLHKNLFEQEKKTQGVGSGVIVDSSGYILTNNHVADINATDIVVTTLDGKEHKANTIWADPSLDLSIIKVDGGEFNKATIGDSKNLTVGEPAIAIGNPLGLTFQRTVTSGIISAVNRTLEIERGVFIEDLIQTDASINPGNSGGPLVNIKGEVIGINTAKVSTAEGIGFAVPINIVKPVIESVVKTGSFKSPYIGVTGLDKEIAGYYNVDLEQGIYIYQVDRRSPAELAGIRENDIILEADGKTISTMMEFREVIFSKKPEDTINLKVKTSSGEVKDIEVNLK